EGGGATAIHQTGVANAASVLSSPLTLVVVGSGLLLMLILLRPWGGLKRLLGLYPAVRAVLVGVGVAGLLAGFLDGAGFVVAGAAARPPRRHRTARWPNRPAPCRTSRPRCVHRPLRPVTCYREIPWVA